jgi:hypothetical protein
MTELQDQDMFRRIWYLPDQWWSTTLPTDLKEWRNLLESRNANICNASYDWKEFPYLPYLFLVNRPFTFGHSQLVMPIPLSLRHIEENVFFEMASIIIQRAIKVFENAFKGEKKGLHTESNFYDLAERTFSYGRYIKTLIMRVSADEGPIKFYKVHLVPYFASNASLCQQRYCSIHNISPDKRGGLIGWLGDKETEVEKWQTGDCELTEIARDIWKLPKVASILREKWSRQQMD